MNRDTLHVLAGKCIVGLTDLGASLAITHCTAVQLTALKGTATTARQNFKNARSGKAQAYLDLRTARTNTDEFIGKARDYLKPVLGSTFSTLWSQIGFESQSLEVPQNDAKRVSLLAGFQSYFDDNETHESAAFNITTARAEGLGQALSSAITTVSNCRHDTRSKRDAQDAAEEALEKKLRCLWKELESVLEPTDARWLKFLDRIPGDQRVPEKVENVTASAQTGGIIVLDWPDAARADRYKIFRQILGLDPEPVLAATVEDSDAQVTDVPQGVTVKLQIVPTNGVGDGPASDVIQLQAA